MKFLDGSNYGPLLTGAAGAFPVVCLPVANEDPDRLIFHEGPAQTFASLNLPNQRVHTGAWNGPTFALSRLRLNQMQQVDGIDIYIGSYFDMLDSAGALEAEAVENCSASFTDLPLRRSLLSKFATPLDCLINGGGVSAAIGGSTMVVFARDGVFHAVCSVRSVRVADQPGKYHVAPSFIFQPMSDNADEAISTERKVSHNIYREYLEELFDVPETIGKRPNDVYEHPNLRYLLDIQARGRAQLEVTGIAFNVMNHRPEICSLLLIQDEDWFKLQELPPNTNKQGLAPLRLNAEFEGTIGKAALPLNDSRWDEILCPDRMTPSGAAAIVLGARRAVSLLGIQAPAWLRSARLTWTTLR